MKQIIILMVILTKNLSAATYGVPVPEELAAYSHWNLPRANAKIVGDQLEVSYCLPVDLVGKTAPMLTFTGKVGSSFVPVQGKSVHGVCMVFAHQPITCMLRYPTTLIDEVGREEALKEMFSGADLLSHERVARFFSNDPAGLLSVDLD